MTDSRGKRTTEHHIELREPEHKCVALIDQHDLNAIAKLLGKPGRQLQATKPGTEHQNAHVGTIYPLASARPSRPRPL
jgi:hypothetical protein